MSIFDNMILPHQVAGHIGQAFRTGQAERRDSNTRNALMQYMTAQQGGNGIVAGDNPMMDEAFQAIVKNNPQMGMQLMQQRQQSQRQALEQHREKIVLGAKIVRQIQPKDQAGWQQVLQMAGQLGIDLSEVPQQFDPQYAQGLVQVADALEPQRAEGTTLQRDYEFLQQRNPQLADQYLRNKAEGAPLIASNGDGTFTIIPRSMAGGNQAPPPPPGFVLDDEGGPTPQASGGFPGGPL